MVHSFPGPAHGPWKGASGFGMTDSLPCQSLSIGTWIKTPLRETKSAPQKYEACLNEGVSSFSLKQILASLTSSEEFCLIPELKHAHGHAVTGRVWFSFQMVWTSSKFVQSSVMPGSDALRGFLPGLLGVSLVDLDFGYFFSHLSVPPALLSLMLEPWLEEFY